MNHIASKDGTPIAFERTGRGPAVILVDGAMCRMAFGPSAKLARLLARDFTVYRYDRRGRGESGDTLPYAPEREVDDIHALITHAGGSASLLGLSSGGALALHAAAAGVAVERVIAYEPPYVDLDGTRRAESHEVRLRELVASGQRGAAISYFMRDMVGAPAFVPVMMRLMFWVWPKLVAVAHTLPYDAVVMTGFKVPRDRFAAIRQPVLVLNGSKTDQRLKDAARAVAASVPGAVHDELAGQTHNVNPQVLAASGVRFLRSGEVGFKFQSTPGLTTV